LLIFLTPPLSLEIDRSVKPVGQIAPGAAAAAATLESFLTTRSRLFETKRNDPTVDALSGLSPYLHFGQIAAQRCAYEAKRRLKECGSFIEELVVRRELADNFCLHQPRYDSLDAAYPWARETLETHKKDKREFVYALEQFESAKTHDPLWNAAQIQMAKRGKMHGFMRMYWAKKVRRGGGCLLVEYRLLADVE
jgi:deoxyribodipyrimidine photo-lyase